MGQRHAVVIGAGIGGLSAAVGLTAVGWRVTVLERAVAITEVGAGISLWPNALRGLDALGLDLGPLLAEQSSGGLRNRRGRPIARWDATSFNRHHGRPLAAIHRAELVGALREALPADSVRPGVDVTAVTADGRVSWTGGEIDADLVVGADGIRGGVRKSLWPAQPEPAYSGATAFRAVTKMDEPVELGTSWHRGAEVGVMPLTNGRVYWWASLRGPAGTHHEDPKAFLRKEFDDWHAPIPALIEATPPADLLHHDTYQLAAPLATYVHGHVCLLGDAAHAMPPFLGQGGCQAIEDAVVLAAAVSRTTDLDDALGEYDRERRPRSQAVALSSIRAGRVGPLLRNPVAVAVRNTVLRALPAAVATRAGAGISGWTPPDLHRPVPPRRP